MSVHKSRKKCSKRQAGSEVRHRIDHGAIAAQSAIRLKPAELDAGRLTLHDHIFQAGLDQGDVWREVDASRSLRRQLRHMHQTWQT